jgi:hypothetical protein
MRVRYPPHIGRRVLAVIGLLDVFTAPGDTAAKAAGG